MVRGKLAQAVRHSAALGLGLNPQLDGGAAILGKRVTFLVSPQWRKSLVSARTVNLPELRKSRH